MLARDAAESRKQMFFPKLAKEAKAKKWFGNFNVRISI